MSNDTILMQGQTINPLMLNNPDGNFGLPTLGRQNDLAVSELHGKYYIANYRGGVFRGDVTAVAIPVIANNLVSVFSLFNPATSGINMEIVDFEFGQDAAATIVDAIGLYYSTNWQSATFTTLGTAQDGVIGRGKTPVGRFYSALTHSGTPTRCAIMASFGATTDAGLNLPRWVPDGKIIIPPGTIVSVAASTTITTAVGLDIGATWAEWPV